MMKKFFCLMLVGLFSLSSYSMECQQREIQIKGFAKVLQAELGDMHETICRFQIDFSKPVQFSVSQVCPLDLDSIQNVQFLDPDCQLADGSEVSGVIVEKNGQIYFE